MHRTYDSLYIYIYMVNYFLEILSPSHVWNMSSYMDRYKKRMHPINRMDYIWECSSTCSTVNLHEYPLVNVYIAYGTSACLMENSL